MTDGLSSRNAWICGPARTRQRSWPGGNDVGDRRLTEEDRDLAEEVAATQRGPLLAVDDHVRVAVENDVEGRSGQALAEDSLALLVPLLLEGVGDALELRAGQVGEQREARDLVDDFVAGWPSGSSSSGPGARGLRILPPVRPAG